jgi:hypothetical protein
MTIRVAFAAQKDFANQIFPLQLFANQNHGVRQTLFATMTAQLLTRLCLLNTSRHPADKYYARRKTRRGGVVHGG